MLKGQQKLNEFSRGWLRHLWNKATTEDDWSSTGAPHPWWDQYSLEPMLSFPRFDLSESAYALLLMGRKTPAWREVYTRILDELVQRHTSYWAAVDWITTIGPDPDRANYPDHYRSLIPKDLWGEYDVPGWTANGVEPWGLQYDPIGSDGNLFFRGFFTLLLGIHRAVSGAATWEKPFEVTGLENRTFPWTHSQIASFLSEQWADNPEGPHCENTKVWPFCLSGAGLGLQLTDITTGSKTHGIYQQWLEDTFRSRYLGFDRNGNLKSVGFYHDPLLNRTHMTSVLSGLPVAFYVLPQNRDMAEFLYRNAVASVGWDREGLPVTASSRLPRMLTIALLLAREFGDQTTENRLTGKLGSFENGRFFSSAGSAAKDEFGFFFEFGEEYPRGQESALLMLRELLDGEGELSRAFNEYDAEKFRAPTVANIEYPKMGLSYADNNDSTATLEFVSYVATAGAAGAATRFQITQLPDTSIVSVLRDGRAYENWSTVGADTIEIETDVAAHRYEIFTGHRSASTTVRSEEGNRSTTLSASHKPRRVRGFTPTSPILSSVSLGCPCCG